MGRTSSQSLVVFGVLLLGQQFGSEATPLASPTARSSVLTADERATLLRYANDTWHSFEKLTRPAACPPTVFLAKAMAGPILMQTSPTDIAAYLWSILAAERLQLIKSSEATSRLDRTLTTLAGMERSHGLFFNMLDPRTGAGLKVSPLDSRPVTSPLCGGQCLAGRRPDDGGQLQAVVAGTRLGRLMKPTGFPLLLRPLRRGRSGPPSGTASRRLPDQTTGDSTATTGCSTTEARIVSYLGIALGQLPPEHYYRMFRTFPENLGPQSAVCPAGRIRDYRGIKVFEGSYDYRRARIVPSWGGSMFEALMVTLFVPEDVWAPRSWGINHPLYARAQIDHGLEEAGYGYWGFSPASQSGRRIPGLRREGPGNLQPRLFFP